MSTTALRPGRMTMWHGGLRGAAIGLLAAAAGISSPPDHQIAVVEISAAATVTAAMVMVCVPRAWDWIQHRHDRPSPVDHDAEELVELRRINDHLLSELIEERVKNAAQAAEMHRLLRRPDE